MKLLFSVAAALLLAAVAWAKIDKENGVLVLTDDNFDEALAAHSGGLLVEMYAPWCGHCKKLTPEYEKAAKQLAEKDLYIAKLDATEHKTVASKYGVRGFPTIKYITKDGTSDYQGGRTASDIVSYVVKKSGPAAVTLDSVDAIKTFTDAADAVVVGFFSDAESAAAKTFSSAAGAMDDFSFGIVTDKAVASAYGATDSTVVVVKKYDEGKAPLDVTADTSVDDIKAHVSLFSLRLVTKFSPETSRSIFQGPVTTHALFFAKELEGELLEAATELGKKYRGKLLQVQVPPSEKRVTDYFGITDADVPTMIIADMKEGIKKYRFNGATFTKDAIAKFEDDFFAGSLQPFLKSEEPADEDTKGPVTILKGKTFQSLVMDNDKDAFVKFHAPWCGHCKALAPKWDELAEKLAAQDSIIIGKMDYTANEIDVPGVNVQGFPTLVFFPGKDKSKPVVFSGSREVSDLLEFVKEKASTPITVAADAAAAADEAEEEEGTDEL